MIRHDFVDDCFYFSCMSLGTSHKPQLNECRSCLTGLCPQVNTLRPRQNGRHFANDTFKRIFLNENVRILIKIPLKFVHKGPINNIPTLVQIMVWRRPGDKPLSEAMVVTLATHICVSRPQWVNFYEILSSCSVDYLVRLGSMLSSLNYIS